jgi:hypothetical protein
MPGVPEPDCRVKPEVRSFNRLGPTSRIATFLLARNFDPLDQNALTRHRRATLIRWIKTRL